MPQSPDSETTTEGIRVHAAARYVPDSSDPDRQHYFFAYTITITNEGDDPARLMSRHWVIKDADNHREDVRGPGVIGESPRLEKGQCFRYESACPLPTPVGTMHGSYEMETEAGDRFEAAIAPFRLAVDEPIH